MVGCGRPERAYERHAYQERRGKDDQGDRRRGGPRAGRADPSGMECRDGTERLPLLAGPGPGLPACAGVRLAHAAFEPGATPGVFHRSWFGATSFDAWQRDYFPACVNAGARCSHGLKSLPPAFWATVVDFGFIAAYSWLLGLFAAWAFKEMAGWHNPNEKVPPLFVLGWARWSPSPPTSSKTC
jgi:hypothetical protein